MDKRTPEEIKAEEDRINGHIPSPMSMGRSYGPTVPHPTSTDPAARRACKKKPRRGSAHKPPIGG